MKKMKWIVGGALAWASAGYAGLILQSPTQFSGTGLGTVPTILTIQDTGTETGCVGATSSQIGSTVSMSGVCSGSSGAVKTGAGQIGPQTLSAALSETGTVDPITAASQFGIVFNANQPAAGPITLSGLVVSFYNPSGTLLYQTSGLTCSGLTSSPGCTFPSTFDGTGNSGFIFVLDSMQQMEAANANVFANSGDIVGLQATVTGASGGPDTFYLLNVGGAAGGGGGGGAVTPEPATAQLFLGAGLVLLPLFASRRKRSQRRREHRLAEHPSAD